MERGKKGMQKRGGTQQEKSKGVGVQNSQGDDGQLACALWLVAAKRS